MPEISGISAGGMPTRVKCLHVLVAHSLAAGPGVNPLGDEALAALGDWWQQGPCVVVSPKPRGRHDPGGGIDCGTNSIRLLVADSGPDGLRDVHREMRVVRLGEGVDRTGRLAPAAIERTRLALADYAATIGSLGASRVRMVATSASRDAANADEFQSMVKATLGVESEVITGLAEAQLSFTGAVAGLPGVADPLLLADIGGGSTELVLGSAVATTSLRSSLGPPSMLTGPSQR